MSVKSIIFFLCFYLIWFNDRFKREEIKIQAWEDHQKAKIEAEMRKVEVGHY
jgi:Remorin, C-terminal region